MQNRTVKIFLLMALIVGLAGAAYQKEKAQQKRSAASISNKIWLPTPSGKHLAAVKVDIENLSEIPESGDAEVVLKGRVLVNINSNSGVSYQWHLPSEVKIVRGDVSSKIVNTQKGEVVITEIAVQGFNRESQKKISLQATVSRGQEILGGTSLIVSRPEETLEAKAPMMRAEVETFQRQKSKHPRGL